MVYLLKDKVHVLYVIKKFFAEIINQLFIFPKLFRNGNALEFDQKDFQTYCASLGILHQTTCSRTSQQNDITQRKHIHILDVARTNMLQMNVLKYLWSDTFLTTTYLINKMPFAALGGGFTFYKTVPILSCFIYLLRCLYVLLLFKIFLWVLTYYHLVPLNVCL